MGQMGHLFKKRKAVSFRGTAMLSLTVIVIPLFIAVIIFDSYTVFQEQASLRESRENTLRMYQIQWEETLEIVETFLSESIAMDSNFSAATFPIPLPTPTWPPISSLSNAALFCRLMTW